MSNEFIVIRYHNISESFATEQEAIDFAVNCGDMEDIIQLTISEEE